MVASAGWYSTNDGYEMWWDGQQWQTQTRRLAQNVSSAPSPNASTTAFSAGNDPDSSPKRSAPRRIGWWLLTIGAALLIVLVGLWFYQWTALLVPELMFPWMFVGVVLMFTGVVLLMLTSLGWWRALWGVPGLILLLGVLITGAFVVRLVVDPIPANGPWIAAPDGQHSVQLVAIPNPYEGIIWNVYVIDADVVARVSGVLPPFDVGQDASVQFVNNDAVTIDGELYPIACPTDSTDSVLIARCAELGPY